MIGKAPSLTLLEFFGQRYLAMRDLSDRSQSVYRQVIRRFGVYLGRPATVDDLTDQCVTGFLEWHGMAYAPSVTDNAYWLVRGLWWLACSEGLAIELPPGGYERSVPNTPPAAPVDISGPLAAHLAVEHKRARRPDPANNTLRGIGRFVKSIVKRPAKPLPKTITRAEPPAPERDSATLTIADVVAAWRVYSDAYYRRDGTLTGEAQNVDHALRPVELLYGGELVQNFGPRKLKAARQLMVEGYAVEGKQYIGLSRKDINGRVGRIKRVFRWAVSEELAPASLAHALNSVAPLMPGRTAAPDRPPVKPVDLATVEATLPHLPPVVADMVRLQMFTGMRPGEACLLRPCDLDRSGDVWEYRPHKHKTEHHGRERVIFIGPKAQDVLMPYLERKPELYCFSPAESEVWRHAKLRKARRTSVQPSQVDRAGPNVTRRPGNRYGRRAYGKAIRRTCEIHCLAHWSPNQLRHRFATVVRREFGLEAAQVILGHSRADVTQVYAERNERLGVEVLRKIG